MAGNYGPNHLGDFFDAMIRLRGQRAQEQQAAAAQTTGMINSIMGGLGNLGQGIGGALQQGGRNAAANSIMNEAADIPRAQSVDRSLQAGADASASNMAGFHTGGEQELKMRETMSEIQSRNGRRAMEAVRLSQATKRIQMDQEQHEVDLAKKTMDMASKPLKDDYHDALAYDRNSAVHLKAIDKSIEAGDKPGYDMGVSSLNSLYTATQKRGLEVEPPNIRPYQSPEDRQALQQAQQDLGDARSVLDGMKSDWLRPDDTVSKIPGLGGIGRSIQAADDRQQGVVTGLEEKIKSLTPAGAPSVPQAAVTPPTAQGPVSTPPAALGRGKPKGSVATDPATGKRYLWNGAAFVPVE